MTSVGGHVSWRGVPGAAGYEVSWAGTRRLVAATEIQVDGEVDVSVRSVDAYGRRSGAATVRSRVSRDDRWRAGLTVDEFDDQVLDKRWHLSGYRGCVNAGIGAGRLAFDMNCGADTAVLRSRTPLVLSEGEERGRIAVITDAASVRGKLVLDLVPGAPDRMSPALPPDALRVTVSDAGAVVSTGAGVPGEARPPVERSRGPGVMHLFEVVLRSSGVEVRQDGELIGSSTAVVPWSSASVLVGVSTPPGRAGRAEIDAIGFSGGAAQAPPVVETLTVPGTLRVLEIDEAAPGSGVARTPLKGTTSARLRATVRLGDGGDPGGLVAQLGSATVPLRAASAWTVAPDSEVTVTGDVPVSLLGPGGPDSLNPFVLRMPGASQAQVVEAYFEVPGPPGTALAPLPGRSSAAELPVVVAELRSDGAALDTAVPLAQERVQLHVTLDGVALGSIAEVAGFEVHVDRSLAASVPTARDGPGVGGVHAFDLHLGQLGGGRHVIEVRLRPRDPAADTVSVLLEFTKAVS